MNDQVLVATPKLVLLDNLFRSLEARITEFAVLVSEGKEMQKALKSSGLTRILKHILSNLDMRSKLDNQVNVSSMQKLIVLGGVNSDFTQSLSQGLTHKELQRLLRLVMFVEQRSKEMELLKSTTHSTSITPTTLVWDEAKKVFV